MVRLVIRATLVSMVAAGCHGGGGQQAGGPAPVSAPEDGWILLFNGHGFDGWEARSLAGSRNTADWTVESGSLVCGGTVASWIHTEAEFADFRLVLEFQGADSVNSGVFLRSQKGRQPHQTGYELNIWDYQPEGYLTGSLNGYLFASASPGIIRNGWNTLDVIAQGDRFVVLLNGAKVLDDRDATFSRGVVGLQCQDENPINFRNIRLLPLDE